MLAPGTNQRTHACAIRDGIEEQRRMLISHVMKQKGSELVTILPSESILVAAGVLAARRIGALVVRNRQGKLAGILSERDIVRAIGDHGEEALQRTVADLMTAEVSTCTPSDTVKDILAMMTLKRFRHVPVVDNGNLIGIVSIGDIVKSRRVEKDQEVAVLRDLQLVKTG
jgi:CBS domain-containing protein